MKDIGSGKEVKATAAAKHSVSRIEVDPWARRCSCLCCCFVIIGDGDLTFCLSLLFNLARGGGKAILFPGRNYHKLAS